MPDPIQLWPAPARSDVSPLMLSHELLELADRAGRAGLARSATRLLELAHVVCTERPGRSASSRTPTRRMMEA